MTNRILMITSEAVPFAKSGGLADMVSALSIALSKRGTDVRILMPRYSFIPVESLKKLSNDFEIPFDNRCERAALYEGILPDSTVPVYFLDYPKYFDREGIYGPTPASAYPDNGLRYSLLSRAALYIEKVLNWEPEVFHSHDWPTAINPVYLKKLSKHDGKSRKRGSVFTIHNLGYQGHFSLRDIPWAGLTMQDLEQYGLIDETMINNKRMNFLKGGIENCDIITTVSPTYAKEIMTPEFGHDLDEVLTRRKDFLTGIVNGVDYNDWNPEQDRHIAPYNYSTAAPENKKKVKKLLQKEMGLELSAGKPLFAMVTRLVDQKGIHELCDPAEGMLERFCLNNDVQVIVLGTGEDWCEAELKRLEALLPNLTVRITYNDYLSHLIEAGADFFMMPSRYEPCGLNQLYSLKYGTLPIVRKTGGLADTVTAPDKNDKGGTGFIFDEISAAAFLKAAETACEYWYKKPEVIEEMRKNAMKQDYSWGPSATAYQDIYKKMLS